MLCIDMRSLGVLDISDSVSRLCPAQVSLHWYWYIDAPSSEQFCLGGNYLPTSISGDEDQPSSEYLASKAQSPSASAKIFSDRFDVLISVSGPRVTSPCTANILNMTNDQLHKMENIRITRAQASTKHPPSTRHCSSQDLRCTTLVPSNKCGDGGLFLCLCLDLISC